MVNYRWHHTERLLVAICEYPASSPNDLARTFDTTPAVHGALLERHPLAVEYVGKYAERANSYNNTLTGAYQFLKNAPDDTEIELSASPSLDPICSYCIAHNGPNVHCLSDPPEEFVSGENDIANKFRSWILADPARAELANFTEEQRWPQHSAPAEIVGRTTLQVLREYYSDRENRQSQFPEDDPMRQIQPVTPTYEEIIARHPEPRPRVVALLAAFIDRLKNNLL